VVARKRLSVTLYIYCLSCLVLNLLEHKVTLRLLRFKNYPLKTDIHVRYLAENTVCLIM